MYIPLWVLLVFLLAAMMLGHVVGESHKESVWSSKYDELYVAYCHEQNKVEALEHDLKREHMTASMANSAIKSLEEKLDAVEAENALLRKEKRYKNGNRS